MAIIVTNTELFGRDEKVALNLLSFSFNRDDKNIENSTRVVVKALKLLLCHTCATVNVNMSSAPSDIFIAS